LHFLGELSFLFTEVRRVLKKGGIFAFSIAPQDTATPFLQEPTTRGVLIYRHGSSYIRDLLTTQQMSLQKEQRLLLKGADKVSYDMLFSVLISRRS